MDKKSDLDKNKKIKFKKKITFFVFIGVFISVFLASQFAADPKYVNVIITTAVFLAGFGLIAMDKGEQSKNNFLKVLSPNIKSIILWSMASIIFSFYYLIFSTFVWSVWLFKLAAGSLFLTILLIVILVFFHDNPYFVELETR